MQLLNVKIDSEVSSWKGGGVKETALDRLNRHHGATQEPAGDLAWWLWDLAGDDTGSQVLERLRAVRKTDDIGRLLLRRRVLVVGAPPSLDAVTDLVLRRLGRRISRQALHNRELDLRRELAPALDVAEQLATTRYLDQELAHATHIDDLEPWKRAVLTASTDPDAAWPSISDAAALVATAISRRHAVTEGWWFASAPGPPGATTSHGMRHVVETLRKSFPGDGIVSGSLRSALEDRGITCVSGARLSKELIDREELVIETDDATVVFPITGGLTLADRLSHLHHVLGITLESAAELLIDQHHANRGSVANAVRDLKRRSDLEGSEGSSPQT